ncbi:MULTISPECIES: ammonium transporter [unclassified Frankia]|uniref:ammonium transporter n=1 Tax=unclassified Frankia TaxID=2632575 RepID=UPI002AD58887|nr:MULTISPECIES: ammonium transporter [unclassified Frankia]
MNSDQLKNLQDGITSAASVGSTAWILAASALVLLMTPGLAFFYGGMVRSKNVLGMLMQNFFCMGVVSILWVLIGYSIAFGDSNQIFGGFHFALLNHMNEAVPGYAETTPSLAQVIPPIVFVAFQLMFAIITPALITGATADRWKFGAFAVFIAIWSLVVYSPVAHWVFSPEGWLFKKGAEDFAGGTVVHANAGAAAIAVALVLGRRKGWPGTSFRPHNLPFVLLGTGLLWFGWFGFNAGSELAADTRSGFAFVNTNTATAAAMLGWLLVERIRDGKATTLGAASGAVAGLVAITPACGFVSPAGSIFIGLLAGAVCALATAIKGKVGIDDALDVGAVHLVGGALGALLIGFFGTSDVAPGFSADGIFYGGGASLLGKQALAVVSVVAYSFVVTFIIAFVIDKIYKMRLSPDEEQEGMDFVLHGETAYEFVSLGGGSASFASSTTTTTTEEGQA